MAKLFLSLIFEHRRLVPTQTDKKMGVEYRLTAFSTVMPFFQMAKCNMCRDDEYNVSVARCLWADLCFEANRILRLILH